MQQTLGRGGSLSHGSSTNWNRVQSESTTDQDSITDSVSRAIQKSHTVNQGTSITNSNSNTVSNGETQSYASTKSIDFTSSESTSVCKGCSSGTETSISNSTSTTKSVSFTYEFNNPNYWFTQTGWIILNRAIEVIKCNKLTECGRISEITIAINNKEYNIWNMFESPDILVGKFNNILVHKTDKAIRTNKEASCKYKNELSKAQRKIRLLEWHPPRIKVKRKSEFFNTIKDGAGAIFGFKYRESDDIKARCIWECGEYDTIDHRYFECKKLKEIWKKIHKLDKVTLEIANVGHVKILDTLAMIAIYTIHITSFKIFNDKGVIPQFVSTKPTPVTPAGSFGRSPPSSNDKISIVIVASSILITTLVMTAQKLDQSITVASLLAITL
ncbi:hypothetical protein CONCODRAFT_12576 [Conidiobolus coronatus NRRL 28638]|uniref:Uncharacterized protein n=1 Tax=Conidiobolus coronatus (strain ATCC 28846 / CBS 209.66 / NRRL 28638) TaxID=796925 RepID=A0A137NSS0_CONC2|nr:hypothetical protein CONCODRAFT_12576 [Conidiobolus coronatus NRRL 28638]|eukprot:KXN65756.1 hypothetical protein CONCODRAFT_12576 [Conidiobolus coronatus NRRL 28638]